MTHCHHDPTISFKNINKHTLSYKIIMHQFVIQLIIHIQCMNAKETQIKQVKLSIYITGLIYENKNKSYCQKTFWDGPYYIYYGYSMHISI